MSKAHYIVRHTVVAPNGKVLGEKTFSPSDNSALSVFEIDGKYKKHYANSFCNKHDFLVASFEK